MRTQCPSEKANNELLRVLAYMRGSERVQKPPIHVCPKGHWSYFKECAICKAQEFRT